MIEDVRYDGADDCFYIETLSGRIEIYGYEPGEHEKEVMKKSPRFRAIIFDDYWDKTRAFMLLNDKTKAEMELSPEQAVQAFEACKDEFRVWYQEWYRSRIIEWEESQL